MEENIRFRGWYAHDPICVPHKLRDFDALTIAVSEEKDLVIIGGGVAGYVAAIKAGQEGMKVNRDTCVLPRVTHALAVY